MIKTLELINFESHANTVLEFSEGVNIITGLSGHGKSSIIRGLNWVLSNSPVGDSMLSFYSTGKDTVSTIEFTDSEYITRSRNSKDSGKYEVSTEKDSFKALRGKVPEEVSKLSNMNESNVQRQKDFYFMLMDSPGQVAKMFNSVSGLEDMDKAMEEINVRYRAKKKVGDILSSRIEGISSKIKKISWIENANKDYVEIEHWDKSIRVLEGKIESIENCVNGINDVQKELSACMDVSAIPIIEDIFQIENFLRDNESVTEYLKNLVEASALIKKELKGIILPSNEELSKFDMAMNDLGSIEDEIEQVFSLIRDLEEIEMELKVINDMISKSEAVAEGFRKKIKKCPTCGRPL
jgi:DNA repair protein SbcC/Rad50